MSFDPITYAAVQQLKVAAVAPKYEYVPTSRTITVPKNAELTIRAMGAGGGGGRASTRSGGAGGTVALKTLRVEAGDELAVVVPAGGAGGTSVIPDGTAGGTLLVHLNSSEILSIPGGGPSGTAADDPVGADWFVKSTPPTGRGGGSAMLLEGYSATATATGDGGAGVLGNGGDTSGGGLIFADGGGGFATADMVVLRLVDSVNGFAGGVGIGGDGGDGGFGGGGGAGAGSTAIGGAGGFGGGGGAVSSSGAGSIGGAGGLGGGGGAVSSSGTGGDGGQGWVTLEWRYI